MTGYAARYSEEFADDLGRLDKPSKEVAAKVIRKILGQPQRSKHLCGPLAGRLRARFLNYRIIYRINEAEQCIDFIKLKKRDEAYR
jgi:mRNA-degrading endonuclease RelE of RelBE toxin-antitoxin system